MPPIPIYTQSPITAAKPSGITPQTAAPAIAEKDGRSQPAASAATASQDAYPRAQPGAVPSIPAPTSTGQSQRYVPVQPTPTVKEEHSGPPPPQPGAVPTVPGQTTNLPPPPKAGESPHHPEVTQAPTAPIVPYPPQMSLPAPTMPHAQRGTSAATAGRHPQPAQPTASGAGSGNDLNSPPGYHQNINAADFDSHQRAAHFANVSSERRRSGADDDEGVWESARKMVQAAGVKLSGAEAEVWRRINKE